MHLGLETLLPTSLILYLVVVGVAILSAFWKPSLGIYLLALLLPLQTIRYRLHIYPAGSLIIDITLLAVALGLRKKGLRIFPETRFNRLLLWYAIATYVWLIRGSLFLSVDFPIFPNDWRVQDWKNYLVIFLFLPLVLAAIRTPSQMKVVLGAMAISVLLLNRSYFDNTRDRDFSHFSSEVRQTSAMGYAGVNGFAAFEAQAAIFLVGVYSQCKNRKIKLGAIVLLITCAYCILFSFSRGAYAATVAGIVFIAVVRNRWLLVGLVLLLASWQTVVPTSVQERITMTSDDSGQMEASATERIEVWEDALQLIRASPLIGTGFNTYAYMGRVGPYRDTHNFYLKILVEMGLVGIVMFLLLLGKMFATGFALYRSAQDPFLSAMGLGFSGMMVAVFVANCFGDRWMYLQITAYTFMLLAMCIRGQQITDEPQEDDAADVADNGDLGEPRTASVVAL